MNAEFAARWVGRLRDPAAVQIMGTLCNGTGCCMMGEAERAAGNEFILVGKDEFEGFDGGYVVSSTLENEELACFDLSDGTMALAGLHDRFGKRRDGKEIVIGTGTYNSLVSANDAGVSFAALASYIEAHHADL